MSKIFIHGLESSGSGFKGRFFKDIFPNILTPDFTGDIYARMEHLNNILKDKKDIIVIGSSFGGLMGVLYALENSLKVAKLILLAPAISFKKEIFENKTTDISTIIFHGTNDVVVPVNSVKDISNKIFKNLTFYEVDDDHLLHQTVKSINWKEIIQF